MRSALALMVLYAVGISGESGDGGCSSALVDGAIAGAFMGGMLLGVLGTVAVAVVLVRVLRHRHTAHAKDQHAVTYTKKDPDSTRYVKEDDFLNTGAGQVVRTREPPSTPAPPAPSPPPTAAKPKKVRSTSAPSPLALHPVPSYPMREYAPITNTLGRSIASATSITGSKAKRIRKSISLQQLHAMGITNNTDVEIQYDESLKLSSDEYYVMDPQSLSVQKSQSFTNQLSTAKKWEPPKYVNVGTHAPK